MNIEESGLTPAVLENTLSKDDIKEILVNKAGLEEATIKEGKVRTVAPLPKDKLLMLISDDISAFDVVLNGRIYMKGRDLNEISKYFFKGTKDIVPNHFVEAIHPNAWVVDKAQPIMVEVIARQYLTGSAWSAYQKAGGPENGIEFCGLPIRSGYKRNEKLDDLMITPTTKGKAKDFPIPEFKDWTNKEKEKDDVPITRDMIMNKYKAFGLQMPEDWLEVEAKVQELFKRGAAMLGRSGLLFVDTKWEFGYRKDRRIILIDESVTPDSSRMWDAEQYSFVPEKKEFTADELSKQYLRDYLISQGFKNMSPEEQRAFALPHEVKRHTAAIYGALAYAITSKHLPITMTPVKDELSAAIVNHMKR